MIHYIAAGLLTATLVTYIQSLIAPVLLGIISIMAVFFLFTRELIKFLEFILLAVAVAIVFYTPDIVRTLADAITGALGVH